MIWFTSDWHLNHKNILDYSNRPFNTVEEINDTIIDNCNRLITTDDDLFFLGDFAFSKDIYEIVEFRNRIKCKAIYFIFGNHDKLIRKHRDFFNKYNKDLDRACFNIVGDYSEENAIYFGQDVGSVTLTHYAMKVWNKCHYGSYHLYGHSHGSLPDDPTSLSFDVGVDCHNYKPINTNQVREIMLRKTWKPIDHHGTRDFERSRSNG